MIRVKSHKKPVGLGLLPEGDHLVRIDSITETCNKDWAQMPWDDKTPQVSIQFKNNKGRITLWVNLKGYMTIEDYSDAASAELDGIIFKAHPFSGIKFAVDLNNNRIENHEKTVICAHILGRIGYCAGIEEGQDIELKDLVSKELAIRVSNVNGQLKVIKTFKHT